MDPLIEPIRAASRQLVRELGFLRPGLAGTELPPSAVHALIELGQSEGLTANRLGTLLGLEKSSVSRMLRKLVEAGLVAETPDPGDARAKFLAVTPDGAARLEAIHGFARRQVGAALARLPEGAGATVHRGLSDYAEALGAHRHQPAPVEIRPGWQPGLLARMLSLQAGFYARHHGFGAAFESTVGRGMADFCGRLGSAKSQLWGAWQPGQPEALGGIAIDGEDLGEGRAHLRWFILQEGGRGAGTGQRLLAEALAFVDAQGFSETRLWTLRGLEAARRLYEAAGFSLAEEFQGDQWGRMVTEQVWVRTGAPG
ncbi:helix-turn-helix domain-containing GNAT family N-acetyltransferase [Roseomonas sp. 18066]|uniref:helix-turn-helix domain-containing GNAT family N-acetyltransferase n=1 Tax=Roseomonas sp. 18066 TaxID=2681412 RepID=UPI001F3402D3|nr:helix-turn-helix domain-containing GNAT family N-acetyltransferase [Roseomonas sp. 18066]